jgi:hypothetical protein
MNSSLKEEQKKEEEAEIESRKRELEAERKREERELKRAREERAKELSRLEKEAPAAQPAEPQAANWEGEWAVRDSAGEGLKVEADQVVSQP